MWIILTTYITNILCTSLSHMCSILTKGPTCRKNKKLRFLLIFIEQVMTNLLKKNYRSSTNISEVMVDLRTT